MSKKENKINLTLDGMGSFLAKFTEHSEQVYWISSADFKKIQYISPSYERIWGRPREELYANPEAWISYLHPDDVINHHPIHEMADKIACLGERARYSEQYRIIRPNGEIRWIRDNGFPLFNEEGICFGVTGIAMDVTKEKENDENLRLAKEAEAATLIAKSKAASEEEMRKTVMVLVGDIVHDLRTPIATIRTIASLLSIILPISLEIINEAKTLGAKKVTLLSKKQSNCLRDNTIISSLQSSVQMMDDFINSTLIELSNAQKAEQTALTDKDLIKCSSRRILENTIESYPFNETIKLHQSTAYDFYLMGNSILIMKILFNLIRNAVEQINLAGNGEIFISTENAGNMNLIKIKDTAGGASPEVVSNLFNGYFTTKKEGTGIGLAFCKKTMQNFGGDLIYENNYGQCIEFILCFPKIEGE